LFCRSIAIFVGLALLGVIDPYDGALLLSIAADRVEGGVSVTQWRRAWPLAGLALAAVVNVVWAGVLGYALVGLL